MDRPIQEFHVIDKDGVHKGMQTVADLDINDTQAQTDHETIRFLIELIRYHRPALIAEAGTFKGDFAIPAALMAMEWGGTLFTYDIIDYRQSFDGIKNLVFGVGDFEYIREHLKVPINFAFIDSGPPVVVEPLEPGLRLRHYRLAQELLAPGGIIAVHDVNSTDWTGRDEIVAEASMVFTFGEGLSLWQKPW